MELIIKKVEESFKSEFNYPVQNIIVNNNYALVNCFGISFYCKLNSKGVKKNSWKLEC